MKVYIFLKGNKLACFTNSYMGHFSYTICFMISEKSIYKVHIFSTWWCTNEPEVSVNKAYKQLCTRISNSFSPLKLLSCVLVIFINMSTYILSEGRKFKTFWKEKAIALDSCYLLIKNLLNMELNILIVLMEFACIRHSWTLQQIWWIPCNLRRWWIY